MLKKDLKRLGTLSKVHGIYNTLLKSGVLMVIFYANAGWATPIPVTVSWLKSDSKTSGYRVEVSDDARFGRVLLTTDVNSNQLQWQAPHEGVYHWRVTPLDRIESAPSPRQNVESSQFASGSFVAVAAKVERAQSPSSPADLMPPSDDTIHLKWSEALGVTAYYIYIQRAAGPETKVVSLKNEYRIPREATSLAIRIAPHSSKNNSHKAPGAIHRFDPGLVLVKAVPTSVAASPALLVADDVRGDEPRVEPLPPPPPPAPVSLQAVAFTENEFPEHRVSEIVLGIYGGRDKTYATQGSALVRSSAGTVSGGRLSARVIPMVGLHLMAQVDGHGRQAQWKDANDLAAGSQPLSSFLGQAGIGFDTFLKNPNRRHQLVLELRGAMGRVPYIPTGDEPFATDATLSLKTVHTQVAGGGVWYRWTANRWGVSLHAVRMVQAVGRSDTQDATIDESGGYVSMDPMRFVTIQLGAWSRFSTIIECAKTAEVCDARGPSKTRSSQIFSYLGLGYVLY